jgi:hypothetical protein
MSSTAGNGSSNTWKDASAAAHISIHDTPADNVGNVTDTQ